MADGQVLIDSKLNTAGVEKGAKELKEEFQDLAKVTSKVSKAMEKELTGAGEAAEDTADSFGKLFKANLSADLVTDALKNMGEAAVDLAKEAVAAAAEINASNAQFEQTFKGVEKVAKESLNAVAKQAGITATRMQDSYTAIFAFSKSVGADQSQALDISARAMAAAADSAAYYDKSIEEATETLQSFLKGNYENDAALGIAATETTRNAKANELYAKSFNELSEAQKVDTLLAMVEAGNKASGALGQAAREADSWNNVTGELMEAWRLLLGVMGDPLLEELIPVIKGITAGLQSLIETTASADLTSGLDEFKQSLGSIDEEFEATSQAIEKNALMADYYRQRLTELEREGFEPNTAASREYANAVDALNSIYPELNLQIDEQTEVLSKNSRAQLSNLDSMKKKAVYAAQENKYTAALDAQEDALQKVQAAERALQSAQAERQALEQQLLELTGRTAEELAKAYADGVLAASEMTAAEASLITQIRQLDEESSKLTQGIEEGNAAIAAQGAELQNLEDELDATSEGLGNMASSEEAVAQAAESATESQEELIQRYNDAREAAGKSLDSQIGLFQKLSLESDMTAENIVDNWEKQEEALLNYAQNLQTAIDMGLDESLVQQMADGSRESMMYLQELVSGTGASVEEINAHFQSLSAAKEVTKSAIAGIKEEINVVLQDVGEITTQAVTAAGESVTASMEGAAVTVQVNFVEPVQESMNQLGTTIGETFETSADTMKQAWQDKAGFFQQSVESPINASLENIRSTALSTWSSIESEQASAWERMVQNVDRAITQMQNKINSLQGKTVNVTVNQTGSYTGAAYSGAAYTPSVASAGIPYLASGAVIPPRAPFMAVLGDQPKGLNIETPEALMRQIVREEAGSGGQEVSVNISFSGDLAQLGRVLQPVIETETRRIGPSLANSMILG